jgi:hypothetical protein
MISWHFPSSPLSYEILQVLFFSITDPTVAKMDQSEGPPISKKKLHFATPNPVYVIVDKLAAADA